MAVGIGIALARTVREHERDEVKRRELERELGLFPGEQPAHAFKRMALGQLELTLELLEQSDGSAPSERAVHDTRKAIKRLRALLGLLEDELGSRRFASESSALRKVASRLSGARDAEVMLNTFDALIERHPGKLRRRNGVRRLRRSLLRQRERAIADTLDRKSVVRASEELRAFQARTQAWRLPAVGEAELIAGSLARLYRQGRKRRRRAERRKGRDTEAMHDWRKRVKSLRYAAEMLERRTPHGVKPGAGSKHLKQLARAADRLGETLGEDHDLAALGEWVLIATKPKKGELRSRSGRRTGKTLLKLIAQRRRKLRKRALREGRRLYRPSAKQLVRRLSQR